MAIQVFEGFETVGTETGLANRLTTIPRINLRHNVHNPGFNQAVEGSFLMDSRNEDGYALHMGTNKGNNWATTIPNEATKTWTCGCWVHIPNAATAEFTVMAPRESGSVSAGPVHFFLNIRDRTDLVAVHNNGLSDLGSAADVFDGNGGWYHIECQFFPNNTTGTLEVKVNGVTELNLTNVDTQNFTTNFIGWRFGGFAASGTGPTTAADNFLAYDDVYHHNDDSPAPTDFLGERTVVKSLPPTGDNLAQWDTTSSGTVHYSLVDENGADTTDYVQTTTNTDRDEFDLTDLNDSGATIHCIKIEAQGNDNASGSGNTLDVEVESGGSRSQTSHTVSSSSDVVFEHYAATDPQGGAAWTPTRVDAMRAGIEFNT